MSSDTLAIEQGVNLPKAYSQSQLGQSIKQSCVTRVNNSHEKDTIQDLHSCLKSSQYATNVFWQV